MREEDAFLGFSLTKGIGPLRFKLLSDYFGSALAAWNAPKETLLKIGLGEKTTEALCTFRQSFPLGTYLEELNRKEIKIIAQSHFPPTLKNIADPPIVLFVKGTLPITFEQYIGVVGSRKPTPYGRQITEKLCLDLAASGLIIVSGLARGVDSISHRAALTLSRPTVAVLGCGVDIVYPPEHAPLYAEIIAKGGAVISEVPPGHTVARGLFPARNRIISGLCPAIVVTEGAEDSGSLITAKLAVEQGRDVFAVPGPITSYLSAGPAKLLKQGAKLVTGAADILEEYQLEFGHQMKPIPQGQSPEQQAIIDILEQGALHFDDIVRVSGLPTPEVSSILTVLELSAIIRNLGDGKYSLA